MSKQAARQNALDEPELARLTFGIRHTLLEVRRTARRIGDKKLEDVMNSQLQNLFHLENRILGVGSDSE